MFHKNIGSNISMSYVENAEIYVNCLLPVTLYKSIYASVTEAVGQKKKKKKTQTA